MFEGHDLIIHSLPAIRRLAGTAPAATTAPAGGSSLADRLVEQGHIGPAELLQAVALHLGCAWVELLPAALPPDVLALVDALLVREYGVVPLATDGAAVSLLALDPLQPNLVEDLSFLLGREVRLVVADPAGVLSLIRRYYGETELPAGDFAPELSAAESSVTVGEAADGYQAGQAPIIRFVNRVLTRAIRDQASDIHFEPFEHEFRIRCRIDGVLAELPPPPRALALPVLSRLKVLANLDIAERRLPQDGKIRLHLGGRGVDLRVSTLPTQFGESVVLRVLDQSAGRLELGQLGMPAAVAAGVTEILHRPYGIFLVTGPTGSGKTTTLYSCLQQLNSPRAKLLTVEDPVEYEIDGIMQVPVNLGAGLTFPRALRSFLRQDPDIVMVGEIRDVETAQIAIQASLTGHLVLSTLHTNDAPGAVTRLMDLGVEPFLLASTLEAVLAQRLLRRICPDCRTPFDAGPALLEPLGLSPVALAGRPFYAGKGCPACAHSGYRGRLGLFEFLRMSEPLRELVTEGAALVRLRQQAAGEGMTSLRAAGLQAILAGQTTAEEVLKYT